MMIPDRPKEPDPRSTPNADHGREDPTEKPVRWFDVLPPWDEIPETTLFDKLIDAGFALPPASELDDSALSRKLHEIIHWLGERRTFLSNTDHLSDRELYQRLIEELLLEWTKDLEKVLPPAEAAEWTHHIDLVGSGSDEHARLYLKYYCDDEQRREWQEHFPDCEMPPKEKPPYDRDRHLPGANWWVPKTSQPGT